MRKVLLMVALALATAGCATVNKTYVSEGEMISPVSHIEFAVVSTKYDMSDRTGSQVTLASPSALRIGDIENVIVGHFIKLGISTISEEQLDSKTTQQKERCVVVEWGVSGRKSRGYSGGYSQEVSILVRNANSGEMIYRGVGEYMGSTEVDDLRGALLAALENFVVEN